MPALYLQIAARLAWCMAFGLPGLSKGAPNLSRLLQPLSLSLDGPKKR